MILYLPNNNNKFPCKHSGQLRVYPHGRQCRTLTKSQMILAFMFNHMQKPKCQAMPHTPALCTQFSFAVGALQSAGCTCLPSRVLLACSVSTKLRQMSPPFGIVSFFALPPGHADCQTHLKTQFTQMFHLGAGY